MPSTPRSPRTRRRASRWPSARAVELVERVIRGETFAPKL
jgi:hypothetical protein